MKRQQLLAAIGQPVKLGGLGRWGGSVPVLQTQDQFGEKAVTPYFRHSALAEGWGILVGHRTIEVATSYGAWNRKRKTTAWQVQPIWDHFPTDWTKRTGSHQLIESTVEVESKYIVSIADETLDVFVRRLIAEQQVASIAAAERETRREHARALAELLTDIDGIDAWDYSDASVRLEVTVETARQILSLLGDQGE